jgi:hypothetical protein
MYTPLTKHPTAKSFAIPLPQAIYLQTFLTFPLRIITSLPAGVTPLQGKAHLFS